jgi:hypothetical protein
VSEEKKPIHVVRAALDEIATTHGQQIVLRGVIDKDSLQDLRVGEYQREALPVSRLNKMWRALKDGESLPDIELGMRGQNFRSKGDEFWLDDHVFIIDGQQRRNAAVHILSVVPELEVRIGCMIHFNTTPEWERDRFKIVNLDRSRVSPNVILRNMRHHSVSILTLYGLSTNDPDFTLHGRVCWKQTMSIDELLGARVFAIAIGRLHSHRSSAWRNALEDMVVSLDKQANFVRLEQWRDNTKYLFDFIDDIWGIRKVVYRDLCLQLRSTFLFCLVMVLSKHRNFWRDYNELVINEYWRKRFRSFPLHDPGIQMLLSGTGGGGWGSSGTTGLLQDRLTQWLNRSLKNRLIPWEEEDAPMRPFVEGQEDDEDEQPDGEVDETSTSPEE